MPVEDKGFTTDTGGKRVFFAAEPPSMSHYKENLIKELVYNGYEVGQIEANEGEFEKIPDILDQYDAAIHLLSDEEHDILKSGKGFQELQVEFTVQYYLSQKLISESSEDLFKIFVWHPKSRSTSLFEEEQLPPHLTKIQQLEEIDFVRTNFEDFKYYLLNNLKTEDSEISDSYHYIKGDNNLSVYFLFDAIDKESAQQYLDHLKKRGYNVLSPQFDGDIMEVRQMHNNCLKNFDLTIIYANEVSANWVNMKIMDILKSPGLGREKEIIGKAILMPESKVAMCPLAQRGFDILPFDEVSINAQLDGFLNKKLL